MKKLITYLKRMRYWRKIGRNLLKYGDATGSNKYLYPIRQSEFDGKKIRVGVFDDHLGIRIKIWNEKHITCDLSLTNDATFILCDIIMNEFLSGRLKMSAYKRSESDGDQETGQEEK